VGDTLRSYRQDRRLDGAVTGMNAIVLKGGPSAARGATYRSRPVFRLSSSGHWGVGRKMAGFPDRHQKALP
jgi:hypothetical protein